MMCGACVSPGMRANPSTCEVLTSGRFHLRVDLNPPKKIAEGSCPDRLVSFLFYSSTKKDLTVSSYLVHFANWMKCVQKYQKIPWC